MGQREDRIARNEALFRDLNERMRQISESMSGGDPPATFEIFCECGAVDCMEKFGVPLSEYEAVRSHPERFILAAGHDSPEVERVVSTLDGYVIVEKHEEEAAIARESHLRG